MNTHGFQKGKGSGEVEPLAISKFGEKHTIIASEVNFQERANKILKACRDFIVTDSKSYSIADGMICHAKDLGKGIHLFLDPQCDAAFKAHKIATSNRKKLLDPLDQGSKELAQKMADYRQVEFRRVAEQQKELEDKARQEHEESIQTQIEELKRQNASPELIESVKQMIHDPFQVPTIRSDHLRSKTGFTLDWAIVIIDKNLIPEDYKTVNEKSLLALVRANKGQIKIPGLKINEITKTTRRGNRK